MTYVPKEYDNEEWFVKVDCSRQIAKIIEHLNKKLPLKNTQLPKYILEDVDMDSYKVDTGKTGLSAGAPGLW